MSELIALIGEGADVFVGSCDAEGQPCICCAAAAEPSEARRLKLTFDRALAAPLIEAIGTTRRVAIDVAARHSFRRLQLKGSDARGVGRDRRNAFSFRLRAVEEGVAADLSRRRDASAPVSRGRARKRRRGHERVAAASPAQGASALAWDHARRLLDEGAALTVCTVSSAGAPRLAGPAPALVLDERHLAIAVPSDCAKPCKRRAGACAALYLTDRRDGADLVLRAVHLHTETSGPLAERLRARLAALAWHAGTSELWRCDGVQVLRVHEVRAAGEVEPLPSAHVPRAMLPALRQLSEHMLRCDRLERLLDVTMAGLAHHLGMTYSMLWLLERQRRRLVLLACHGYAEREVGAELPLGHSLAGIAAATGLAIRIAHLPWAAAAAAGTAARAPRAATPCPGLSAPGSQLAVPLRVRGQVVGALFVEDDTRERCLDADDEDALSVLAASLSACLAALHAGAASAVVAPNEVRGPTPREASAVAEEPPGRIAADARHATPACRAPPEASAEGGCHTASAPAGRPLAVRYHERDGSVFLDHEYLVRGVAGALFWKLARAYVRCGRSEFSTRELRLCAAELRLPDVRDNLYTRVLLLERRLAARAAAVRIERTGRGRFRLRVERPLWLLGDDETCLS